MAEYLQNLERQGLRAKILRNKDLALECEALNVWLRNILLAELSRMGRVCAFLNSQ